MIEPKDDEIARLTQQLSDTQRQNAELLIDKEHLLGILQIVRAKLSATNGIVGVMHQQFQNFVDAKQSPDWPDFDSEGFVAWCKSRSALMVSSIAASKVNNEGDGKD